MVYNTKQQRMKYLIEFSLPQDEKPNTEIDVVLDELENEEPIDSSNGSYSLCFVFS